MILNHATLAKRNQQVFQVIETASGNSAGFTILPFCSFGIAKVKARWHQNNLAFHLTPLPSAVRAFLKKHPEESMDVPEWKPTIDV